ncbi:MAG TPA: hypothetical protein VFO42_06470 [Sphingomicrobium sp.]|nr:hypothetical protein [Sphingomicrobium sp.]
MAISSRACIAALGLCAAACAPVDHGLGEAVKYDMALQTIDPDPIYPPGSAEPGTSGTAGAEAAKRYRTGTVKPIEVVNTAKTAAAGSGSDSGPK